MILKLTAVLAFLDVLVAGLYIILCAPFMQRRLRLALIMIVAGYVVLLGLKLSVKAGLVSSGENAAETRAGSWRAPESP